MSYAFPILVGVLLLAAAITCQVFAWKRDDVIFWVITFVIEVFTNLSYFGLALYNNAKAAAERETVNVLITQADPLYARLPIIDAIFGFLFLGMLLISLVLVIGQAVLKRRGEY